jgi:malic enzyme
VVGADFIDVVEQAVERAAGELVAVEGDQAGVGGDQRRAGVEVQRRRRVDPDFVVAFERIQRLAQLVDLVARFELGLQFFQCRAGGQDGKVLEGRRGDEVFGRQRAQLEAQHLLEEFIGREFQVLRRLAQQVLGRIGLRVEVDDQGAGAARGRDGRQVAGDGALADAAFLIENNALHAASRIELLRILPAPALSWISVMVLSACPAYDARLTKNKCRRKSMSTEQENLSAAALEYHEWPTPGKIAVVPTKGLTNQRDLALAYSPGVAAACNAIVADPAMASRLTSRANLVGVVTNGTAVLGLGNIGPLAGKPVMEGKGVLFKKFAGIDVFDIELAENDPDKLVDMIAAMEPTFGGINLEDIKAPECFYIEAKLRERMKIPVFHDDQHGTAIVVGAAMLNGLNLVGKKVDEVKLVTSGAGAAALACLDLLVNLGVKVENIWVTDIEGVVYVGREKLMDPIKDALRQEDRCAHAGRGHRGRRRLPRPVRRRRGQAGDGGEDGEEPADPGAGQPDAGDHARGSQGVRDDAIIATGRSDYPNQVNNVLCFPFIFRGALDAGATTITEQMKLAAVRAIAELAQAEASDVVAQAYGGESPGLRPRVPDPAPLRPAPDRQDRPGGGQAGDGIRRGDAPDQGFRRLPRASSTASSTTPASS